MYGLFLATIAAIKLLGSPGQTPHTRAIHPAQLAPSTPRAPASPGQSATARSLQAATEAALRDIQEIQRARQQAQKHKAALRNAYNAQLAEVDRLKRGRASWRRDRNLREQKARSLQTAEALRQADATLRALGQKEAAAKTKLVEAIQRELPSANPKRRQSLSQTLQSLREHLRPRPKTITMPDLTLDELADPEELLEQIALIEQVEAQLARQEQTLERQAARYHRMDTLRAKHRRAGEIGAFENDGVRRSTGITGPATASGNSDRANDAEHNKPAPEVPDSDPQPPAPGFGNDGAEPQDTLSSTSIILADVVDSDTQLALRRAERSSPKTKATLAKKAHTQVRARLKLLRASKERIRKHLEKHRR